MYAIVEARHIHHLGEATLQGSLSLVHTLGNRAGRIILMTDILQMLGYLHTLLAPLLRNLVTDDTESNRSGIISLLVSIDDCLQTFHGLLLVLGSGDDFCRYGLGCACCDIENLGIRLQCTIIVVSTNSLEIEMSEALTVVVLHYLICLLDYLIL
jgi:hypothetical protein